LGNVANNAGIFGTNLTRTDLSSYGLLATFGVSYVASSRVRFGLRAQSAMAQIYGKGESFSISRTVLGSATPTVSGENVAGAANYGIPFDIGLGTALKPVDWLTFLADVSLQLPMSYQQFPASLNDQVVSLGRPRASISEWKRFLGPPSPAFWFLLRPIGYDQTSRGPGVLEKRLLWIDRWHRLQFGACANIGRRILRLVVWTNDPQWNDDERGDKRNRHRSDADHCVCLLDRYRVDRPGVCKRTM